MAKVPQKSILDPTESVATIPIETTTTPEPLTTSYLQGSASLNRKLTEIRLLKVKIQSEIDKLEPRSPSLAKPEASDEKCM